MQTSCNCGTVSINTLEMLSSTTLPCLVVSWSNNSAKPNLSPWLSSALDFKAMVHVLCICGQAGDTQEALRLYGEDHGQQLLRDEAQGQQTASEAREAEALDQWSQPKDIGCEARAGHRITG